MRVIRLPSGLDVAIDDLDYDRVTRFRWHAEPARRTTYAIRDVYTPGVTHSTSRMRMHRFILDAPKGLEVDHIDGNGLNNTRANLRLATAAQNRHNLPLSANNTSGFKGVSRWRTKTRSCWKASIGVHGRARHIGYYDTPEEAARAYDRAALEHFGEFAWLNFADGAGCTKRGAARSRFVKRPGYSPMSSLSNESTPRRADLAAGQFLVAARQAARCSAKTCPSAKSLFRTIM